jgi:steroid delta-isomerase-like uncharacterized protein
MAGCVLGAQPSRWNPGGTAREVEDSTMSKEEKQNKKLTRRFYKKLNAGDLSVIDELISEDLVEHDEFAGLEPSKAGVRHQFEWLQAAFPDGRLDVEDMIAEDDKVFVRARMTGTHQGEFMGLLATGRTINVGVADYLRFKKGMVVEHWGVTDTGAMTQQLTGA